MGQNHPVSRGTQNERRIKSVDSLWYDGTDSSQAVSTQSMEVVPDRDRLEPFKIPREEVTFIQPISETSCPYVSHQSLGDICQGSLKGKKVAIKGLPTDISSATKRKFEPELHQYLGLRHPHLLPVIGVLREQHAFADCGPSGGPSQECGGFCLVLPWMALPLTAVINPSWAARPTTLTSSIPKLSTRAKIRLLTQVAKGVRFLHSQDPPVLHTNLTCQTVLLDHQGNAKVSGYGFAELRELITHRTQRLTDSYLSFEMARCYMVSGDFNPSQCGHPNMTDPDDDMADLQRLFVAEEVLEGHAPTMASDVYSFGMLCWLLLTNGTMHPRDYKPPVGLLPDVPVQLETLIEQCLSRDTLRRPTFQVIGYVLRTIMLELKQADALPQEVHPQPHDSDPMIWGDEDPPSPTHAATGVPLKLEGADSAEATENSSLRVESHLFDFDTDTYGVLDSHDVMVVEEEKKVSNWVGQGACHYQNGEHEEAVKWFERGAEYGHAPSQSYLGQCYYEGRGTMRLCQKTGAAWWLLAAAQGHVHALYNLGIASFRGKGRPQSYSEAVSWWLRAAAQGHALAEFNLGSCYQQGLGTKRSAADAVYWYALAAAQSNRSAMYNVALILYQNPNLNELYQGLPAVWLHTAARKGHVAAQSLLGRCYEQGHTGLGIKKSRLRAINWHMIAAERCEPYSLCYLAVCFLQGHKYIEKDEETGLMLLRMAGTKGNGQACYLLGQFYERGQHGVHVDTEQALQWYTRGSQRNHAQCRTAMLACQPPRKRSDSLASNTL
eukprot:comp22483_c0_seq1/m.33906 comp22483_c0_seq1/g.33906  ORF comp22483_c0_seq1/g.33906 comp22483_c0_seq1/m.33906 type:complete len:778 (-) comp22483_c0_seq1:18-2351(-)